MVRKKLAPRISVGGKAKMEAVEQGESKKMMVRVSRAPNATSYYTISAVNEGEDDQIEDTAVVYKPEPWYVTKAGAAAGELGRRAATGVGYIIDRSMVFVICLGMLSIASRYLNNDCCLLEMATVLLNKQ